MLGSIAVMSQAFPARVPAAGSAGHCRVLMDGPPADRSTGRHTMPSTFQRIPAAAVSPQHAMIQLHAVPEGPASSGGPTFVDSAVPVPANKPDNDPTTYVDPAVLIPANKLDNKNTHNSNVTTAEFTCDLSTLKPNGGQHGNSSMNGMLQQQQQKQQCLVKPRHSKVLDGTYHLASMATP